MAKTDKKHSPKKSSGTAARDAASGKTAASLEEIVEAVNTAARAQNDAEAHAIKAAAKASAKQQVLVELKAAAAAAALRAKRSAKELAIAESAAKVAARDAKKAAKKLEKASSAKKSARKAALELAEKTRAARERLDAIPTTDRGMVQLPPEDVEQPTSAKVAEAAQPPADLLIVDHATSPLKSTEVEYRAESASDLVSTGESASAGEVASDGEGERATSAEYLILPYGTGRHARTGDDLTASGE